jgi:hypothetical protein
LGQNWGLWGDPGRFLLGFRFALAVIFFAGIRSSLLKSSYPGREIQIG